MGECATLKKLGIIGGLGPAATASLFVRIIEHTDAATDQDHIDITILNRPQIPDRTAYILGKSDESYVPAVREAALQLEAMGCDVLCMPCVTGHYKSEETFGCLTRARVLHMPLEAARYLAAQGKRAVGVMATDGTGRAGVLQQALESEGLAAVFPDAAHQAKVMSIIYDDVKAGRPADMQAFDDVCAHLRERGCDSVLLGCTELSVIDAPAEAHGMLVADALEVLAVRAVEECGARVK
ncbi:MAG: amino acid racemase [Slackia sp.]|nr:amino acid racemase [Slackia sp.]